MRLTLRTMLAYMDEILEPADHQAIEQKINESEFATDLMHRVRDTTRRLRLGAPKLAGKGMGLDPNTVSEYLDNTLSAERVPDFEKVCLESDVHLAEVAACHQVLALVLGEPADVDPAMRRRMYDVAFRADAPQAYRADHSHGARDADVASRNDDDQHDPRHSDDAKAAAAKAPPPLPKEPARPTTRAREARTVPDYLRADRRSRMWAIAATLLLAVVLGGAVVRALGPFDASNPVAQFLGLGQPAPNNGDVAQNNPAIKTNDGKSVVVPGSGNVVGNNSATGGNTVGDNTTNDATKAAAARNAAVGNASATLPVGSGSTVIIDQGATNPGNGLQRPVDGAAVARTNIDPAAKTIPPDGPALPADVGAAPIPPIPANSVAANTSVGANNTVPRAPVDGLKTGDAAPDLKGADPRVTPAGANEPVGRFSQDTNVLLRYKQTDTDGAWERLAPGTTLHAQDLLLVLPTFRPTLTLTNGVSIQLLGETLVELLPPDARGIPGIRMPYGRMTMLTSGKPDVQLRLSLGGKEGTVTLVDPDAMLSAEVRRYLPPGSDPEKQRAFVAIDLYASTGESLWTSADRPMGERMKGPRHFTLAAHPFDPAATAAGDELPKWIVLETLSGADQRASTLMNPALTLENNPPVALRIRELADHPTKFELRYLAARSLALIDEFDTILPSLNDSDQRAVWPKQIESLQAALARGPDTALRIRETFERQRGEDGLKLYRMLWGYSRSDIQNGAASALVEYMDHDNLDFRVLAFHSIRSIPGVVATLGFFPEGTPATRQAAVRRWREAIKTGPLSPKGAMERTVPPVSEKSVSDKAGAEKAAPVERPAGLDAPAAPPAETPRSVPVLE